MNRFSRLGLILVACAGWMAIAAFGADGPSVTIHTVDEATRTGKLTALKDGQVMLSGPTTRISLADIVDLTVANGPAPKEVPPHKLTGTVIGTAGSFKDQGNSRDKAFDGKLDTFFDPPLENHDDAWVGLDLGSPKIITQVKYSPRNGRNGFFAGRVVDSVFQGCDSPDFQKDVVTLYTIADRPETNKLTVKDVSSDRPVRYVRLTTGSDKPLNVSEIEFWGKDVVDESPQSNTADKHSSATTGPSTAPYALSVKVADDNQLTGTLVDWTDKQLTMHYPLFGDEPLTIPVSLLHRAWHGTLAQVNKARAMTLEPGPEDAAFVLKDKDIICVRGVTLGIEGDALKFKFNDEERKINLAKFIGVILGGGEPPKPDRTFHQRVELPGYDSISGTWTGYDAKTRRIQLQTMWGQTVSIPFKSITKITFANGRLTYLSDLKPANVEQTPYLDRLMPYQIDHSLTGGTLKLSDGEYTRGIAVHSRCVLTYDLDGAYETFKARIGFQQPEGKLGQAPIRVLGDGKVLWHDEHARGDATKPADVSVSVTGVKQFSLEVDFGDNGDTAGRVDFANARLLRAPHSP